ncbi:hypothetical protein [Sneathiella sp.]|uniref:hypothetical protein n=1 Tax=Sneathiella sp. TaxID=1964365 RepID=UPI002FE41331
MALYMKISSGEAIGGPVPRPSVIPYTDPGTGEVTTIRTSGLDDAALLALADFARVDPEFSLSPFESYVPGGSFDAETGLATPNKSTLSISAAQAQAVSKVRAIADSVRAQIAEAGPYEIAAWPVKAERARRYLAGVSSPEDEAIIAAEATARGLGETIAALAAIQQSKALALATVVSVIDGMVKAAEDAVAAAADPAAAFSISGAFGGELSSALNSLLGGEE